MARGVSTAMSAVAGGTSCSMKGDGRDGKGLGDTQTKRTEVKCLLLPAPGGKRTVLPYTGTPPLRSLNWAVGMPKVPRAKYIPRLVLSPPFALFLMPILLLAASQFQ